MKTVTELTQEEVHFLLVSGHDGGGDYVPIGLFFCREGDTYVGIDNSTGDAWVEGFTSLRACVRWLLGEDDEDEQQGT